MTEERALSPDAEEFLKTCEEHRITNARGSGITSFAMEDAEEFAYALVEGGDLQSSGAANEARRAIQQRARQARKGYKEWTGSFPSLGASADEVIQAHWRRLVGIMRICMAHVHFRDPEPVKRCEKVGAGGTAPGDSSEEQPKDTLDGTLLNSYIKSSLSKHLRFIGDVKEGNDDDNKRNWGKVKAVFSDPASRKARGRNCPGNANIEFEIVSGSHLLGYGYDGNAINNDKVFDIVEAKCGAKQRNYFWVVIDVLNASPDATNDLLTYVYRKLCGDGKGRQAPKAMKANGLMNAGVYGLEGVVIARRWPTEGSITKPVLALQNVGGQKDMCWGGDVWLAWLLTLYQRAAAEDLANSVSDVGDALIAPNPGLIDATENNEKRPSSFKEFAKTIRDQTRDFLFACLNKEKTLELTDEMIKNDKLTILKHYWISVIALETKWMYREVSRNSDVDIAYQHFQECYDIEAMWNDVREQTELIARYAEMEHERIVSKTQTYGGIIFGSAIFLAGFYGMNVFGPNDLLIPARFQIPPAELARLTPFVVFAIVVFAGAWFGKSTSFRRSAVWLRQRPAAFVGVSMVIGLVSIALYLLFELILWAIA